MRQVNESKLEDLILVRLSARTKKPPAPSDVSKSLHAMLARQLSASEWRAALARSLATLRARGLVQATRLELTAPGMARVQAVLKLSAPPRAKGWRELKMKYLPRALLGAELPEGAAIDPGLALLAERLGVPLAAKATAAQVVDAWLARTLGIAGKPSPGKLRAALLARELGAPRKDEVEQVLRVAVAALSGAPKATGDAVTNALALRWLFDAAQSAEPRAAEPRGAPLRLGQGEAERRLERVVEKVRRASDGARVRSYGGNKIFIASVWEALASDPEVAALGEQGFKAVLAEAHRRGLVVLSRADLVAAMDPKDLAASEIKHLNATYHFIQRGAHA
jgi:hypothetical protein